GPAKPVRTGHRVRVEHLLVGVGCAYGEEIPDARPEVLELVNRPPPQLGVVGERTSTALAGPAHVARHLNALAVSVGWLPQGRLLGFAGHRGILAVCGFLWIASRVSRAGAVRVSECGHGWTAAGQRGGC